MVQWLGLGTFTAMAWVQSLVRELRSYKPLGVDKKKKKRKKEGLLPNTIYKKLTQN